MQRGIFGVAHIPSRQAYAKAVSKCTLLSPHSSGVPDATCCSNRSRKRHRLRRQQAVNKRGAPTRSQALDQVLGFLQRATRRPLTSRSWQRRYAPAHLSWVSISEQMGAASNSLICIPIRLFLERIPHMWAWAGVGAGHSPVPHCRRNRGRILLPTSW